MVINLSVLICVIFGAKKQLMKKEIWQKIVHIAITILTAIATTFGVSSCMGH